MTVHLLLDRSVVLNRARPFSVHSTSSFLWLWVPVQGSVASCIACRKADEEQEAMPGKTNFATMHVTSGRSSSTHVRITSISTFMIPAGCAGFSGGHGNAARGTRCKATGQRELVTRQPEILEERIPATRACTAQRSAKSSLLTNGRSSLHVILKIDPFHASTKRHCPHMSSSI